MVPKIDGDLFVLAIQRIVTEHNSFCSVPKFVV